MPKRKNASYNGEPYEVEELYIKPRTLCQCGSCHWNGPARELVAVGGCALTPGDPSPAGRCPNPLCQALAYPVDRLYDNAKELLRVAGEVVEKMETPRGRRASEAWDKLRALIRKIEGKK